MQLFGISVLPYYFVNYFCIVVLLGTVFFVVADLTRLHLMIKQISLFLTTESCVLQRKKP